MNIVLKPGALRLTLALVVVGTHVGWVPTPLDGVAVTGFFLLSGYWVTTLWDARYSRCEQPAATFYVSRAWRIYPLAVIGTLAAFAMRGESLPLLVRDLLLLPGPPGQDWPIDPPLWSLTVELQFYAIAPLMFVALRQHVWAMVVFAIGIAGWTVYILNLTGPYLPVWLTLFAAGILYARAPRPDFAHRIAPYSLAATLICAALTYAAAPIDKLTARALVPIVALLFAPYVAASIGRPSSQRDKRIGDLAFPLFVIHMPAARWAATIGLPGGAWAQLVAASIAALALWVADIPVEAARQRFVRARKKVPPQSDICQEPGHRSPVPPLVVSLGVPTRGDAIGMFPHHPHEKGNIP